MPRNSRVLVQPAAGILTIPPGQSLESHMRHSQILFGELLRLLCAYGGVENSRVLVVQPTAVISTKPPGQSLESHTRHSEICLGGYDGCCVLTECLETHVY